MIFYDWPLVIICMTSCLLVRLHKSISDNHWIKKLSLSYNLERLVFGMDEKYFNNIKAKKIFIYIYYVGNISWFTLKCQKIFYELYNILITQKRF